MRFTLYLFVVSLHSHNDFSSKRLKLANHLKENVIEVSDGLATLAQFILDEKNFDPYFFEAHRRYEVLLARWKDFLHRFEQVSMNCSPVSTGLLWRLKGFVSETQDMKRDVEVALKRPWLGRLCDLGLHSRRAIDEFASAFCDWYAVENKLLKPRVKVWLCTCLAKFEVVNELMSGSYNSNSQEYPKPVKVNFSKRTMACIWTVKLGRVRDRDLMIVKHRLIRPLFKKAETVLFVFTENAFRKGWTDVLLKWLVVHELLHAFEHKNKVTLITAETKEEVVKKCLIGFLEANPKFAFPLKFAATT
jgi:hypothetical protein